MALINCKDCGKQISGGAKACPNCGSVGHIPFHRKHPLVFWGLVIFVLIPAGVGALKGTSTPDAKSLPDTSVDSPASPAPSKGSAPKREAVASDSQQKDGKWKYASEKDEMRGVTNYWAKLTSTNEVDLDFPYKNSRMNISVRKLNNEVDVLLDLKGQFSCSFRDCYVAVKFDDGPIQKFALNDAGSGETSVKFIANPEKFIPLIKKSKTAIIEAEVYRSGRVQYNFDLTGLVWEH